MPLPAGVSCSAAVSALDNSTKVAEYINECKECGIQVLPPDVNESDDGFTVVGNNIRFGLVAIKNIGRGFIHAVMDERERNGKFQTFDEFCRRMYGKELNRRAIENLIRSGAFDSLGYRRSQLMQVAQKVIDSVSSDGRKNIAGQLNLFNMDEDEQTESAEFRLELPDIPEYTRRELMAMEKETTGMYLTGHPMDEYRAAVRGIGAAPIGAVMADFAAEDGPKTYHDEQQLTIAGVVSHVRTRTTRNNTLMSYITLEDDTGVMEVLAFQKALDSGGGYVRNNEPLIIQGRLSQRDEKEPQLVADSIRPLGDLATMQPTQKRPENQKLWVRLPTVAHPAFQRIQLILKMFPGHQQIILYFTDTKKRLGGHCVIHTALVDELKEMLGEENVVVK